ncbi:MAG: hypothetical protein WD403_10205 [Pirellulales bacterium]
MKRMQALVIFIVATLASAALGADHGHRWFHRGCGSCSLKVEHEAAKQECYEIECKQVCIPPVRFPWQKCHGEACGRVRTVRVLKAEEHDVERCVYKWEVHRGCAGCGQAAGRCQCGLPANDMLPARSAIPSVD